MNRRMLFVRLPHFATERFLKAEETNRIATPWWQEPGDDDATAAPTGPLVLVDHGPKGTRISAPGVEAFALGLWPDMKLADARTMVPLLRVEQHDRAADAKAYHRLARWMTRWSPSVCAYDETGLLLDITGCAHLFGGEAAMVQSIRDRLAALGLTARIAVADHASAAVALVDHGAEPLHILTTGHAPDALDDLAVEALRLDGDTIVLLKRLGLKRIGDVRPIPRAALERRFREKGRGAKQAHAALSVQMRLDQLCGRIAEPLTYIATPRPMRAVLQCPDMALEQEAVATALATLLEDLAAILAKAGQGARLFLLIAYRADGGTSAAQVRLSQPARDAALVARLFRERLEQIDCGFGVDMFALEAGDTEALGAVQAGLNGEAVSAIALGGFADTVSNRAGPGAVVRFAPRASHVPERMQRAVPVHAVPDWAQWQALAPVFAPRPLRLLQRPERADVTAELPDSPPAQFVWRKVLRRVIRARGPERILPEWWHDSLKSKPSASFRDYYDVEDTRGLRYWIFRAIHDRPVTPPDGHEVEQEPEFGWDHGARLQNPTLKTQPVREVETVREITWFVHGLF